ncbi:MAG: hypothetical protein O3C21_15905 [Verrucomicrobia bacterium]|nr:hypothetical protein [Verrucomicrobiota bacterium]
MASHTEDDRLAAWGAFPDYLFSVDNPSSDELQNIRMVGAGGPYAIAIRHDGTWVGIGSHQRGTLLPPDDIDLSRVSALDIDLWHAVALMDDGTVKAWGRPELTRVPEDLSGVTAIACGSSHTLALKQDGTVVSWSEDGLMAIPENVQDIIAVAAGHHGISAVLDRTGSVYVWTNDGYCCSSGAPDVPLDLGRARSIDATSSGIVALVPLRRSGEAAFEQWRKSHFGTFDPVGHAADGEDLDLDGLNNAMEFATGGDPRRFGSPPLSVAVRSGVAQVTYRRNPLASGLFEFILETIDSLDAETWTPLPASSADWVTARDNFDEIAVDLPVDAKSPRFVRLRTIQR